MDSISKWVDEIKNTKIDSNDREVQYNKAFKNADNLGNDTLKTKYYSELSLAFLKLRDSLFFRKANNRTLEFAKTIKDSNILAAAHWDLGLFLKRNNVTDSAFYHYREAQQLYENLGKSSNSGSMMRNMAILQSDIRDYTGSEVSGIKALEILKPLNNHKQLYNTYNHLGIVANALGEYDRALDYHQQAKLHLNKLKNKDRYVYGHLNNVGSVYKEKGDYKKAIENFKIIVDNDSLKKQASSTYAFALNNLAESRMKLNDTVGIYKQLNEALKIRNSSEDLRGLSVTYHDLADYMLLREDTVKAMGYAEKAKEYSIKSDNNKRLLKTWQLMARLEPEKAVAYTQKYVTLNDSLQQVERRERNKFARIQFETEETEAENALLAKQRQMWIGIAVGVLALAFSIFVIISQRVKNQRLKFEQQQQESNQEIFNLLLAQGEKVEEGKKSEQKRISEELHDGVLGQLLGIRLILSSLNKKNDEETIEKRAEFIGQLQGVATEVRAISHALSDAAYQKIHNFTNAIHELVDSISASAQIACSFRYDDTLDWDSLQGEAKINIYRIVQESLQNCVKHAACDTILVNFENSDEKVVILIKDDGKGFNQQKGKKGIGLKNITSRIEKIKGTFSIESELGKGTKVVLEIPLEDNQNSIKEETTPLAKGA
ncbi:tetratricopeptide repeat-containing sensor histidine kinase [Costertonia aggregata]|uniref:Oxygen sensor histidine kinase NreB n=1 Tax=Costertonia aggregata TaxID=343403 RepID=A0A7H9AJV3_9FLAO|nr:sensor histidine kinase [Costertonia aggregata]QLG43820.1 tetratricopeptide repeat protein [Costertonia aggregata]